ncbi:hypothetical protein Fmac_002981 [Flemingia macrophylla]|uniref:Legume lectin domain-containing protein n=1 Tax=Flemingia macrophylla TaxID=520843 RepID=A0ABD1NLL4_9FABA
MANPNSNPFSVFLMTFIFSLSLFTSVKSDSFSFNLPTFEAGTENIALTGDAKTTNGALRLTKTDQNGIPIQESVGLSAFFGAIHLSDRKSGRVANFHTEFSFVVNTQRKPLHGDGFTFFIASYDFHFTHNSSGGFLGLFNEKTAFNTSVNQVVAVEFDSFANEWDPNFPESDSPHIGIDIGSIKSVVTAPWTLDVQPIGIVGKARINYQSSSKILTVTVAYPNSAVNSNVTVLSYPVNLGAVLSEWVVVGFSGATGDLVETHGILSWSFSSFFWPKGLYNITLHIVSCINYHTMAFLNSKPNLLQSIILVKFLIPFLLLQHHIVKSQYSPALANDESFSFGISVFNQEDPNIVLLGNATISGGVLRLTNTDPFGNPVPHSVGRVLHFTPVHLWNKHNGELADFIGGFSFVVNSRGSSLRGDGFAFFLAPVDFHFPRNSSGGYLGLFSPENAFDPSRNQVVAIEFDSFTNDWDPSSPIQIPHIGIDVDSVKSVAAVPWPTELESPNAVAYASLNYNSESKRLSVFVSYPDNRNATVSAVVDLRNVLPEWIMVGFSASTGDLVETHDILNWYFEATL